MLVQRGCDTLFMFWVSGGDIHWFHHVDKVSLLFAHLLCESTQLQQPVMVVDVGRVVVAGAAPVGLDGLLQCLMALEGNV